MTNRTTKYTVRIAKVAPVWFLLCTFIHGSGRLRKGFDFLYDRYQCADYTAHAN